MEGGNGVRISYIQPQTLTSTFIAVCSNYFLIHFSIIHMTQLLLRDMTYPNLSAESPFSILYVLFGVVWPGGLVGMVHWIGYYHPVGEMYLYLHCCHAPLLHWEDQDSEGCLEN